MWQPSAREKGEEIYRTANKCAADIAEELGDGAVILGDLAERTAKGLVRSIK